MLIAHFDASTRDGGEFCVAGIAFGTKKAVKAVDAWQALWGDQRCHMTELHSRPKGSAFESWTPGQAGARLVKCCEIINRYATYAVAVSCELAEINELAPQTCAPGTEEFLDGFSSAYAVCCHMAMSSMGKLVVSRGKDDGGIAYVFEAGDLHQGKAQNFLTMGTSVPPLPDGTPSPLKGYYSHASHTVRPKEDSRLFEMSDILAWEWAKHRERVRKGLPMRPSLGALLGQPGRQGPEDFESRHRRCIHLTGERFARYFRKVGNALLLTDEEALPYLRAYLEGRDPASA